MTIILLGESGCGKSSVANELCKNYNYYQEKEKSTAKIISLFQMKNLII